MTTPTSNADAGVVRDGWIEHDGGPMPVSPETMVRVKFRSDFEDTGPAYIWCWDHAEELDSAAIIAYRVIATQTAQSDAPKGSETPRTDSGVMLASQFNSDAEVVGAGLARAVEHELTDARRRLHPYADATEISGMSWSGFNIIGDSKSIAEVKRLEHRTSQMEAFQQEFNDRLAALKEKLTAAQQELFDERGACDELTALKAELAAAKATQTEWSLLVFEVANWAVLNGYPMTPAVEAAFKESTGDMNKYPNPSCVNL